MRYNPAFYFHFRTLTPVCFLHFCWRIVVFHWHPLSIIECEFPCWVDEVKLYTMSTWSPSPVMKQFQGYFCLDHLYMFFVYEEAAVTWLTCSFEGNIKLLQHVRSSPTLLPTARTYRGQTIRKAIKRPLRLVLFPVLLPLNHVNCHVH